jgi:hypothetical protein
MYHLIAEHSNLVCYSGIMISSSNNTGDSLSPIIGLFTFFKPYALSLCLLNHSALNTTKTSGLSNRTVKKALIFLWLILFLSYLSKQKQIFFNFHHADHPILHLVFA